MIENQRVKIKSLMGKEKQIGKTGNVSGNVFGVDNF